jgi:hypothetical protein
VGILAILEKEVWIGLSSRTISYYENLGYDIPKRKDANGRDRVPRGTKIFVKIDDLSKGSNVKVTKICDECSDISYDQPYDAIIKSRNNGDGKDRCFNCGAIKNGVTQRNNVTYENSLEFFAKQNNKGYLLNEFSAKNIKKPNQLSYGTKTVVWWNCPKCQNEYDMDVKQRTMGRNCPYCCVPIKRINETNNLWKTHPHIAELIKDTEVGNKVTWGSHNKVEFCCSDCGYEQQKTISKVAALGKLSCSKCGDGLSYPEKFIFNILEQLKINFETQKIFEWSKNKRYDFYIPSNIIIEAHGMQHYVSTGFDRTLEDEIKNDQYKLTLAKENNMKYFVIDCRESTLDFIKNSILNSDFSKIYNLDKINWQKAHEFAFKTNLVKESCDLWNSGVESVVEIGKLLKLSRGTIVRYLKLGAELSWCNYDPIEVGKKSSRINGSISNKEIVQLNKDDGNYIKTWNSSHEAARELSISQGNISYVCIGKRNHTGGYRWMYKEEYDKLIRIN